MSAEDEPQPPATPPARVVALDVLRGIAILGILPVNLPSFALPQGLVEATHAVSPARAEALVQGVLYALIDFKLISIFALLFGAGLELQAFGRPGREARSPALRALEVPRMLRRLGLLAVLGLLHGWGLWFGDVLLTYAAVGAAAVGVLTTPLPPRALATLGAAAIAVPATLCLGYGALVATDATSPMFLDVPTPPTVSVALERPDLGAFEEQPGVGREVLVHRHGAVLERLALRVSIWTRVCEAVVFFYSWRIFGLMLLGAAAVRVGLLAPDPARRRALTRLAVLGLGVGLPIEVARAWLLVTGKLPEAPAAFVEAAHQLASLGQALGYAALVVLAPPAWLARAPLRWLGTAGRCALSCYLAETVVSVFVFDGLGWFGHLTRVALLEFALAVWAALLLGSGLWMRRFAMGPVEWAWRSLSDGRARPLLTAIGPSSGLTGRSQLKS